MAAYVNLGRFGDDVVYPEDGAAGYDAGGYDYPNDVPIDPGVSYSEPDSSINWGQVGATALTVAAGLAPVVANALGGGGVTTAQLPPGSTIGPGGSVIPPNQFVASGSINSSLLLVGGLGLAALFFLRKK